MATTTTNIGLTLPASNENVSRQVINGNWELIDTAIGNRKVITTETRTLEIPSVPIHTAIGKRLVRKSSEVDSAKHVIGYEVLPLTDSDMEAFRTAPYHVVVNVTHTGTHGPDSHDWIVMDAIQDTDNSSYVDALTVTIKTYSIS